MKHIGVILLVLVTCLACNDYELESRNYPSIDTKEATDISITGATLHGEFLALGTAPITDHGFVYGEFENPLLEISQTVSLGASTKKGEFTAQINQDLKSGKNYYYRTYATVEGTIIYGQQRLFTVH